MNRPRRRLRGLDFYLSFVWMTDFGGRMKRVLKAIGFLIIEFLVLIVLYIALLTIANIKTSNKSLDNMTLSVGLIDEEGDYPSVYGDDASKLDNFTDRLMIQKCMLSDDNPFLSALNMGGYQRYWHGYVVFLKPLFSFANILQIRKLLSLALFILATVCITLLYRRTGWPGALAFSVMWAEYYLHVVSGSLQYFWCCFVCCLLVAVICLIPEDKRRILPFLFFGTGSFVSFVDLLTFPLITLTVPLIVMAFTDKKKNGQIKKIGIYSVLWGIGYMATWATKWLLGYCFLGKGIVSDVSDTIVFRMIGDASHEINRLLVLQANLQHPYLLHHFVFLLGVTLVSIIPFVILTVKENKEEIKRMAVITPILLYPYCWYEVVCSHSLIHHFFTYRTQMGTSFGLYLVIFMAWKGILAQIRKQHLQRKIEE